MDKTINGIRVSDAMRRIIEVIIKSNMYDQLSRSMQAELMEALVGNDIKALTVEWNLAWSISTTMYISFNRQGHEKINNRSIVWYKPKVEITWSSTGRTPAMARAAINLYSQVNDLACLIEAITLETTIYDVLE